MKLISTIYSSRDMDFVLTIQNRNTKGSEIPPGPLVTKHISKIGNESLIFNPSVAIVIRNRQSQMDNDKSAWITHSTFYRFITSMTTVYQGLSTEKLYHQENGTLYLDKKKAVEHSRRLSLYRNALTIAPAAITQHDGTCIRGIELLVDTTSLGILSHTEVLSLLTQMDHFDITTFSLLAGVVDELEGMSARLSTMEMKIDELLTIARQNQPPKPEVEELLNWQNLDITRM